MTSPEPSAPSPIPRWRLAAIAATVVAASITVGLKAGPLRPHYSTIHDESLRGVDDWLVLTGGRWTSALASTRGELRRPLHWLALAAERELPCNHTTAMRAVSECLAAIPLFALLFGSAWVYVERYKNRWKTDGVFATRISQAAAALCFGAAWLSHPARVEPIACASQQGTVLGGALVAAAAFFWWRAIEPLCDRRWVTPSLVAFALALLADPTLCFAPVALLALTLFVRRDDASSATAAKRPLVVASVLGVLAFVASYAVREPGGGPPFAASLFAAATQIVRPIRSLFWPVGLHPGYDAPPGFPDEIAPSLWIDAATVAALVALCAWGLRRRHGVGAALLAYFACVAGRVVLGRDEFGADGDGYVATIPLFVAAGVVAARAVGRLPGTRAVLAAALCVVLLGGEQATAEAQRDAWRTDASILGHVLDVDPTNERALVVHGDVARMDGKPVDEAASWYRRALDAGDWRPLAHARLGAVLLETGDAAGARTHLERAVAIAPWIEAARYDLGALELREGKLDAAKKELEAATRLDAASVDAWLLLARARDESGDRAGALDAVRRAAAVRPDDAEAAEALQRLSR